MTITLANSIIEQASLGKGFACPLATTDANGDLQQTAGEENVDNCIRNLLNISVGECVMNEDMGIDIMPHLFGSEDALLKLGPTKIKEALLRYEPRIKNVSVTGEVKGSGVISFRVIRTIRATGRTDNLVFPYYLEPLQGGVDNA